MKVDLKETEKTAALLLSGASTYILNTIATLEDHIEALTKELHKKIDENAELGREIDRLKDSLKSVPALSEK